MHDVLQCRLLFIGAIRDRSYLIARMDDALGPQKPDREVEIIARRSHRHGDAFAIYPDLKWFLDDDIVFDARRPLLFDFQNGDTPGITHGSALYARLSVGAVRDLRVADNPTGYGQ